MQSSLYTHLRLSFECIIVAISELYIMFLTCKWIIGIIYCYEYRCRCTGNRRSFQTIFLIITIYITQNTQSTNKVPFKAHDTLWLVLLISKYNKPHVIFMRFNTSWPAAHLSISEAKSLSNDYPPKPSTTITIKHLAAEPPNFVFTNMTNPMEPHSFLTTNQIRALPWFIIGRFAHEDFFPRYPPLMKWNWFRGVICFYTYPHSQKIVLWSHNLQRSEASFMCL